MDTRKFSIHGKGKAKESKAEPEALDRDAVYSVVSHMERTLFIVDLSKLEAEGDTLVEAMVLYRPMHEFKKVRRVVGVNETKILVRYHGKGDFCRPY